MPNNSKRNSMMQQRRSVSFCRGQFTIKRNLNETNYGDMELER